MLVFESSYTTLTEPAGSNYSLTMSFFMNFILQYSGRVRVWLCVLALAFNIAHAEEAATASLAVSVYKDVHTDYQRFTQGRDIADIDYYGGPGARRDVVEVVLLQQALLLGGFTDPLELRNEQTYLRTLRQIADGVLVASGSLVWYSDVLDSPDLFHISQPIVKEGEFILGVYTSPNNKQAMATKSLADLRALRAVTNTQWETDIALLKNLNVKQVYYADEWLHIVRMINAGRADFTFAPFQPSESMELVMENMTLVPINGIKVMLPGSRHWAVSRKHPRGDEFYRALYKGIEILKKEGRIQRAYRENGFFRPEIQTWTLLNPPAATTASPGQ